MHHRAAVATLFACALLAGCGGPRVETVEISGKAPLNVNEAKESTPVKVRIYQLRGADRFRSATPEALWTGDKKTLENDLIGEPLVVTVSVDGSVKTDLTLSDAAMYLGVLGLFSKSDAKDNRILVLPLEQVGTAKLVVTGYSVTIDQPGH